MKTKTFNYVSKFKYLMLAPIVILLLSIVFGAIFGLNLDYDFKKVSNFSVKFNTTVTELEYDNLEDGIDNILSNQGFSNYRLERIGTGAQNAILVKIPNNDSSLNNKIADVKLLIEESLLNEVDGVTSSVVISLTETDYSLPKNVNRIIWLAVLSVACVVLFAFAYTAIRYNFVAGCSLALSLVLDIVMLFTSMVAFRIPFNYYFVLPFIVMLISTILNATYMNNYIKSTLSFDSYSKVTNSDRVIETTNKTFKGIITYTIMLIGITLAVMFFGGPSLIFLGLAVVVGLIISTFVSLFVNTSLWSMWYKKDKDKMLKRRVELEKQRELNKNDKKKKTKQEEEKIVV